MKTVLQIKLLPTNKQKTSLLATMKRFNQACDYVAAIAFENRLASKFELQKLVYKDIRERFDLTSQAAIRVIAKVVDVYKRDKDKQPSFKPTGAIVYDQRIMRFKGLDIVNLWTLDGRTDIAIQMGMYQKARWNRNKGQADLTLVNGVFFLLVSVETPEEPPMDPTGFIGVDLGIVNIATDSDGKTHAGEVVEATRQRLLNHRSALQAKGTKSAKRRLKKISRRESHFRRHENHVISKQLVQDAKRTGRGIGLEELKHIRARVTVKKADRAKHSGWSFYQLQQFIDYKSAIAGVPVVYIDPAYTSQECHTCGHTERRNRRSQSEFVCVSCHYSDHADLNAALNISKRAAQSFGL